MDRNEKEFPAHEGRKDRNEREFPAEEGRKDRNEREFLAQDVERPVKVSRPAATPDQLEGTEVNPPRTTEKGMTSPKFGSAGSGGAEFEGPQAKN